MKYLCRDCGKKASHHVTGERDPNTGRLKMRSLGTFSCYCGTGKRHKVKVKRVRDAD